MSKCDIKSAELRAEGNAFYSNKKFFEAMVKYNESLCIASKVNVNRGLAYANRSAVYLEMKLYDKSLKNIQMAIDHSYPKDNMDVLKKRKEKCQTLMGQQVKLPSYWSFFKLSDRPNKKLPFVVDSIELKVSDQYGKHIVTNKNLKVGDILAIEKPFCSVLISESRFVEVDRNNKFIRCTSCLSDNQLDLIPCDGCNEVMFCSQDCQQKALKRFHKLECPVMKSLIKSGSVNIAIRIFFTSLSAFNGSINDLEKFISESENLCSTIFDFDFSVENRDENIKNYLKCLSSLGRSSKLFNLQPHVEILSTHSTLKETWTKHETFIKSFLQRLCQTNDHYFHGIFGGNLKKVPTIKVNTIFTELQQSIGSGWFPFCSLINHSCAPNVIRVSVDGRVALIVCRPIQKGSQLFDCYKQHFNQKAKPDRQTRLMQEFNFLCNCEACENNFPCPPHLNFKDLKLLKFAKKVEEELLDLKPNQAWKKYRDCCETFEANHQTFPCVELSLLQKCMGMFLLLQAKPLCQFS